MTPYFEAGKKHVPNFLVSISQYFRRCRWCIYDMYDPCIYMEVCVWYFKIPTLRLIQCFWGNSTQVTSKDGLTSGYINIILPQMAETYLFFGDSVVQVKVCDPKLSQFRVLYQQDLFFSQFSGFPLFAPQCWWTKLDPSLFELQRIGRVRAGVEVAFKRYGNQDVPLVTSSPWSSTVRPLKNAGWEGNNHSANPTLRRCLTHLTLRFPPFVSAAVALVQRHTDNETLGWWLMPLHLSTHLT